MNTHTPEPWHVAGIANRETDGYLVWDSEAAIAHIFPRSETSDSFATQAANARRIVACVNACAGISNEQLAAESRNINERAELERRANAYPQLVEALRLATRQLAAVSDLVASYPRPSLDPNGRTLLDAREMPKAAALEHKALLRSLGEAA